MMNDNRCGNMTLLGFLGVHMSLASLLLRLAIGVDFVVEGYSKTGAGRKENEKWLKDLGVDARFVLFAVVVELLGGIGLILGLLTPIVAVLAALWMVSTMWLRIAKGKEEFVGGYELDVVIFLAALALAVIGGGTFSLDHLLGI
jgi:putative oxidoreductase